MTEPMNHFRMKIASAYIIRFFLVLLVSTVFCDIPVQAQIMKKIAQKGKTKGRKAAKRMVGGGDIDLSAYMVEEGYEIIGF